MLHCPAIATAILTTCASAAAVNKGPLEPIEVFILAGQSNAVGARSDASGLPPELYAPQEDIPFWFEEGPWNSIYNPALRISSGGAFIDLQFQTDTSGATFLGPSDGFGPEIKMGRDLADELGRPICIVKFAINATDLAENWNPNGPGPLYGELLAIIDSARIELLSQGRQPHAAGFFWMQGEWDARSAVFANAYETNLTNFIAQLRADLAEPALPFIFGRLNENIYLSPYDITIENLATVRAAQESVAATVPGTAMVDTDDLPLANDWIHFIAPGQLMLGERFAAAFIALTGCPADVNADGFVDVIDLLQLLSAWGAISGPEDINGDGIVDVLDLLELLSAWGPC